MRKIYFIIILICIIIFGYWIFTALPSLADKALSSIEFSVNSATISSNSFAFKSSPEKSELLTTMLIINTDFIKSKNINNDENIRTIKNFYKLEKFFPNFKYYYISKLKLINSIFTELPKISSEVKNLSNSELTLYFNSNADYLSEKLGIKDLAEFSEVLSYIKKINGENEFSCELEDSYLYSNEDYLINLRLVLTLEDSSKIYIPVIIEIYGNTDNQNTPLIKFLSIATGGTEYE